MYLFNSLTIHNVPHIFHVKQARILRVGGGPEFRKKIMGGVVISRIISLLNVF